MGGIQEEETEVDEVPSAGEEFRSKTPIEEAPFEITIEMDVCVLKYRYIA